MKMKQVYIWSAFWKHGWILLKPGVQVSIGHGIIENKNRVTGRSKIPQECKNGDFWATYAVHMRSLGDRVIYFLSCLFSFLSGLIECKNKKSIWLNLI
jgi:hypothetical protein